MRESIVSIQGTRRRRCVGWLVCLFVHKYQYYIRKSGFLDFPATVRIHATQKYFLFWANDNEGL